MSSGGHARKRSPGVAALAAAALGVLAIALVAPLVALVEWIVSGWRRGETLALAAGWGDPDMLALALVVMHRNPPACSVLR